MPVDKFQKYSHLNTMSAYWIKQTFEFYELMDVVFLCRSAFALIFIYYKF